MSGCWRQAGRTCGMIGVAAFYAAVLASAGCSAVPESAVGALDPRLAWPCDRLVVDWEVDSDWLQAAVGDTLQVRTINGEGRLQLHVMRCAPGNAPAGKAQGLFYSYVLVPISAERVPISITRMPADGWFSLQEFLAGENARAPFARFGYESIPADIDFMVADEYGELAVQVDLMFRTGRITVDARATDQWSAESSSAAILGGGSGFFSVFFGAEEYLATEASATVEITGQVPVSVPGPGSAPASVRLHRRVLADRVYWRLPAG